MSTAQDEIDFKADLTLQRLEPQLEVVWQTCQISDVKRHEFELRLSEHWRPLFGLLFQLYRSRYDFFYHVEQVLLTAARGWAERPDDLCELDRHRINEPNWFLSEKISGGALYVDLFGENFTRAKVQWLA